MGKLVVKLLFVIWGISIAAALATISASIFINGIQTLDTSIISYTCLNASFWIISTVSYMITSSKEENKNK